jgi:uncharacterized protein YdaU (DUF1376 family)
MRPNDEPTTRAVHVPAPPHWVAPCVCADVASFGCRCTSVKVDIFMPIYIGDYLRDTRDLSTEEHGAYFLILMSMWTAGGKLPAARLNRFALTTEAHWPAIWEVIGRFFEVTDGIATQKRLSEELVRALERREVGVARGMASVAARRAKYGTAQPDSKSKASREQVGLGPDTAPNGSPNSSPSPSPSPSPSESESADPERALGQPQAEPGPDQGPWTAPRWLSRFKLAWEARNAAGARAFYGDTGDTKAQVTLSDELGRLPGSVRALAEASAPAMFAAFFKSDGREVKRRQHPFSFFVQEFGALRTAAGKNGPAAPRDDRPPEIPRWAREARK